MNKCSNCGQSRTTSPCCNCSRNMCPSCMYCEIHDCPNILVEIERDMNRFKEKIKLIDT